MQAFERDLERPAERSPGFFIATRKDLSRESENSEGLIHLDRAADAGFSYHIRSSFRLTIEALSGPRIPRPVTEFPGTSAGNEVRIEGERRMEPESMRKGGSRNSNCVRRINNMRSMHNHYTFEQTSNRGVQIIMKKLILAVFMFALIAGASVNSTANATLAETSSIAISPNLAYCLWGYEDARTSGYVLGGVGGGAAGGWAIVAGYGLAATVGIAVGVAGGVIALGL